MKPMDPVQIAEDTVREVFETVQAEIDVLKHLQTIAPSREVALAITNYEQGQHWIKEAGHGTWLDTPTASGEGADETNP